MIKEILFLGAADFAGIFAAFGFESRIVSGAEEFRRALAEVGRSPELKIIFAPAGIAVPRDEAASLAPSADIYYLPEKFDRGDVAARFRSLSEKASGVDLTGKLSEKDAT